jgi:hypothetical protein
MKLLLSILVFASLAFAAGGACPSGANYTNPANPTGPLVTLSSLGITTCYFVSASGSDSSYDGTTETVSGSHGPFLHSPGMPNCASNCSDGLLKAGVGIIFRGGDTWHTGNSSASPYTGNSGGCSVANPSIVAALCTYASGTSSSSPIYFGVDKGWYSGSSWARPIFNGDNSLCNSLTAGTTLPDGATCTAWTDRYGQPGYYVSSCAYQTGASNNTISLQSASYEFIDNFEFVGLCMQHTNQPSSEDAYIVYPSANAPLYFLNNYFHGQSHIQFQGYNADPNCHGIPEVCTNGGTFAGSVTGTAVGETVVFNVVDYSDSDPPGTQLCYGGFYNVAYNYFGYTSDCIPNPLHVFHDNIYEYFFENGHSNLLEDIGESPSTINAVYNNVFRHVETHVTSGGGVEFWLAPPTTGYSDYFFNNLSYDVGNLEYIDNGGTAGSNANGNYVYFNNTFQTNNAQGIMRVAPCYTNGTIIDTNNHYVDDQSPYLGTCTSLATTTALSMTNAVATSDGYTASQTYGYSPTSGNSPTVGPGTNETSRYCAAMLGSGDALIQAAGTACESDISYGVSYNATTHTVSYPARTANSRPASAAWDVGAYQFSSSVNSQPTQTPPQTPSLTVTVH